MQEESNLSSDRLMNCAAENPKPGATAVHSRIRVYPCRPHCTGWFEGCVRAGFHVQPCSGQQRAGNPISPSCRHSLFQPGAFAHEAQVRPGLSHWRQKHLPAAPGIYSVELYRRNGAAQGHS